jgi:hypothetical protein
MSQQELTEEEELFLAESEAEAETEFCMNFVMSGGLSSEWRQAYRVSKMTEKEFGEFLETQFREMHGVGCFCLACQ